MSSSNDAASRAEGEDLAPLDTPLATSTSSRVTTLRELLPESSRRRWAAEGIADRPLDLEEVMTRAQLMAASMAANKLLNEVLREMHAPTHERLLDAIDACLAIGVLNRREAGDLRHLNRVANQCKHDVR